MIVCDLVTGFKVCKVQTLTGGSNSNFCYADFFINLPKLFYKLSDFFIKVIKKYPYVDHCFEQVCEILVPEPQKVRGAVPFTRTGPAGHSVRRSRL